MTGAQRRASCFIALVAALATGASRGSAQAAPRNPHGQLQEPCGDCHRADAWTPVQISKGFDHGKTGFPLIGAHAGTACRYCHASLDFRGTARDCVGCHKDIHQGELGRDCARCHSTRSFVDRSAMVRAHQATRFPLSGAHVTADCEACHTPTAQGRLTFVNRPAGCVECHGRDYQSAKEPDHVAGGFPQDCNQCHSTATWPAARFNHATSGFPLTGAHRAVTCQQCHGDGVYKGKSTTCVSCHQRDYDGTTDPAHKAAGFSTDCSTCHSTTSWAGATFDHDATFFPIYSGAHRGQWTSCATCHTNPSSYQQFYCLSCHAHDKTSMDSHHAGISGYRYDSQACYSCHPRGTN